MTDSVRMAVAGSAMMMVLRFSHAQSATESARAIEAPSTAAAMPASTRTMLDVPYVPNGHERQKLDLFVPPGGDGRSPLIIWVHGGGWQNGSKANCLPLRLGFLQRGYAIASINYRLSSHAIFPAQIEDVQAAIRFLRDHAKEYGLDPGRFVAWGSSAGGHLVALAGTVGDAGEFAALGGSKTSSRVQAVCDFYGPADFPALLRIPGYNNVARVDAPESKLLGAPIAQARDAARRASPVTFVTPDDPPFLIFHGENDPVVPPSQSALLYAALLHAGVDATYHVVPGARHGGPEFSAPEIMEDVDAFFRRHLKPAAAPAAAPNHQ